ncbi:hypothetical protein LTR62_008511 [Meristemomyces frigidus]|uniref:Nuclear pore complex component n=1 Tax=Meristemomyces frigidus TaxID=1508187 RepID=A0AAN7TMX0_9PEZI|nr:hypothetical protein LTR62_008511 [Meristemomyces frigidus]
MSSTTSLVQRTQQTAGQVATQLTPTSLSRINGSTTSISSPVAAAAPSLPKFDLTPLKSTLNAITPTKQSTPSQQASPAASTPGQWQHPRMQEVIRRRKSALFDSRNVRVVGLNVGFMVVSVIVPFVATSMLPQLWIVASEPYFSYSLYLLRAFFALNICLAFAPFFQPKDNCDDVPLTPSQRQLLGLPPMSRPATPQEQAQYVTPPRYSRSATPQSNNSNLRAQASSSPLSGRGLGTPLDGELLRRSFSGSPRPSPFGSPAGQSRRSSFARNASLSTPEFDAVGSSYTPTKNNKASVGLNSKWLYEKSRGSSRSSLSGLSGFGGGGSIFN